MNIIPISASAGITGFESPAAEYHQLACTLDEILIEHPSATFIGKACTKRGRIFLEKLSNYLLDN